MSDLIERSEVLKQLRLNHKDVVYIDKKECARRIEAIPSARPKEGKWIDMGDFEQCSACKGTRLKEFQTYYGKATWIKTDFCPNCGADMRGDRP